MKVAPWSLWLDVRCSTVTFVQWWGIHYSQLRMAAINLQMSCISHINYTASVGSAPINVKNANGWLGKREVSRRFFFFFFFLLSLNPKSEDLPSSHLTWQWRISSLWGERDSLTWGRSRVLCGEKGEQIFTRLYCHFCTHLFRHQRRGGVVITASVKWTLIRINWWSNAGTC